MKRLVPSVSQVSDTKMGFVLDVLSWVKQWYSEQWVNRKIAAPYTIFSGYQDVTYRTINILQESFFTSETIVNGMVICMLCDYYICSVLSHMCYKCIGVVQVDGTFYSRRGLYIVKLNGIKWWTGRQKPTCPGLEDQWGELIPSAFWCNVILYMNNVHGYWTGESCLPEIWIRFLWDLSKIANMVCHKLGATRRNSCHCSASFLCLQMRLGVNTNGKNFVHK